MLLAQAATQFVNYQAADGCLNFTVNYGVLITLALMIPTILAWRYARVFWNALQPKQYKTSFPQG